MGNIRFEVTDVEGLGRLGKLEVNGKVLETPMLFPVVHPYRNALPISELERIGARCLFMNAYILYQKEILREEVLKQGIHEQLNFRGMIASDSGAFQQYMYDESEVKIDAAEIEGFQEQIGVDFGVILDVPVQLEDDWDVAKKKIQTTITRAKENIRRRQNKNCHWFGPIHGAHYLDLLKWSARCMDRLDFAVNAIGGLVKAFLDYRFDLAMEILLTVKGIVRPHRPIHMFGLGLPQFFSLAVACGCDLMDSAAYILFARENRYFTLDTGTHDLNELVEFPCHCPVCESYVPQELQQMEASERMELLAKHNLYLSFSELRKVRQAIREGTLWELVESRIRSHPELVKAFKVVKKYSKEFEMHEKIYKPHGRLFTSQESRVRPLFYRHEQRICHRYRPPRGVKYLIILPELDMNVLNTPTLSREIEDIKNNTIVSIEELHVAFLSYFFGFLPLELSETFPLGQHESFISVTSPEVPVDSEFVRICEKYLNRFHAYYQKAALWIPSWYHGAYNEYIELKENALIEKFSLLMKTYFKSRFGSFKTLKEILEFFKSSSSEGAC
ncbi:MAG: tRNA guanosine(15) transglycosylase TgtA [Promethearchaeota archaeon]